MMLNSLIALVLASAPALAQDVSYTAAHNVTPIIGTWSSGSQNVLTGSVSARLQTMIPSAFLESYKFWGGGVCCIIKGFLWDEVGSNSDFIESS